MVPKRVDHSCALMLNYNAPKFASRANLEVLPFFTTFLNETNEKFLDLFNNYQRKHYIIYHENILVQINYRIII